MALFLSACSQYFEGIIFVQSFSVKNLGAVSSFCQNKAARILGGVQIEGIVHSQSLKISGPFSPFHARLNDPQCHGFGLIQGARRQVIIISAVGEKNKPREADSHLTIFAEAYEAEAAKKAVSNFEWANLVNPENSAIT